MIIAKKVLVDLDLQQNEVQNASKVTTAALTLANGNEGVGRVMTSDAAGNVDWAVGASGTLAGLSDTNLAGLAAGDIVVYDGVDSFDNKVMSGDITINTAGATAIGAGKVTFAQVATGAYSADLAASATATEFARADAIKSYVDAAIATADTYKVKGNIDASANPNYPAGDAGDAYVVSVAGKIGGAAGENVEVGDVMVCINDATAAGTDAGVGGNWTVLQGNTDATGVYAALGIAAGDTDMGTFTGSIITDNGSAKAGMQELETDLEALQTVSGVAAGATDNGTFTGTTVTDNVTTKVALQELETAVETKPTKYVQTFGDGAAVAYTINHALNDADVIAQVRDVSGNDVIECEIVMTDANNVTVTFSTPPSNNDMRIVCIG